MGQITVEKNMSGIEGVCVITPAVHGDYGGACHHRGEDTVNFKGE